MTTRLNPTNFGYQNFYSTTLTGDITSGTLTIGLATVPTPSSGVLVIEPDSTTSREVIVYTSKGASTITCPSDGRGYSGTSAAAHLTGSTVIMAPVDKWFTALASGELSTDPMRTEHFVDYFASGCVWSADAAGSTRNASMTSGVAYVNGRRLTLAAVSSRSFTASKDTYIDVSDNGDGTGLITYNEVSNNAASPSLAANNVRLAIVTTGASNIATANNVNIGQTTATTPVVSGNTLTVNDSLGNLIGNTTPRPTVIGYRIASGGGSAGAGATATIPGLSCPVIFAAGRRIRVTLNNRDQLNNTAGQYSYTYVTNNGGTQIGSGTFTNSGTTSIGSFATGIDRPTGTSETYLGKISSPGSGTASTETPSILIVELA